MQSTCRCSDSSRAADSDDFPPMAIRTARPDDLSTVMGILDGALLAVDAAEIRERIENEAVLVATDDGRILGVCVLDGREIDAIAVRRNRRGQGIGTALVETAAESVDGDVTAEFHRRARPFYESLGFASEPTDEPGRFRGILPCSANETSFRPSAESADENGSEN